MPDKKIHICYLANASSIHVQKWVDYFNKRNYKISVISFSSGNIKGAEVYFINLGFFSHFKLKYILGLPQVKKLLFQLKPDILHAIYLSSYGLVGALTDFHPLIISAIGSDILVTAKSSFIKKFLARHTIKKADLINSQATHLTKELMLLGAKPKKIITFSYGIDLEQIRQKKEINPQDKKQKIVISTRTLEPIYNLELLIRSVPKILKEMPEVKIWLIGSGREEKKLKELASELRISQSIEFLGKLSNQEVLDRLEKADVYVSTSLSDGSSISLLEAIAKGVFPVVTDIPANREWIKDNINGFLCPTDDPSQLSKRILEALTNNALRKRAAEENKTLLEEKGSYQKNIGVVEKRYLQLIRSQEIK